MDGLGEKCSLLFSVDVKVRNFVKPFGSINAPLQGSVSDSLTDICGNWVSISSIWAETTNGPGNTVVNFHDTFDCPNMGLTGCVLYCGVSVARGKPRAGAQ